MPPPSVFQQPHVTVTAVRSLVKSPRNYNASIIEFEGQRLMAYRSHRMDQQGRCGLVICALSDEWEATANTWLDLPDPLDQEDPRLFVFKDRLHVSFTETQFHASRPYTCVMKYARLIKGKTGKWKVERVFFPRYGKNSGSHQEKNWLFFEAQPGRLHVVYDASPHTVLELHDDGETVIGVTKSKGVAKWAWGAIHGGTPPLRVGDQWLTVFHSATPYPIEPHWRRYYAGAYMFSAEAPYEITAISQKPILVGSADDGHAYDPRKTDTWKPFVVFPSGVVKGKEFEPWVVSYGVNDHMTVIAEHEDFFFGDPGLDWSTKYFRTDNASKPVKIHLQENRPHARFDWTPAGRRIAGCSAGVMAVTDPRVALHLIEEAGAEEISKETYENHTLVHR